MYNQTKLEFWYTFGVLTCFGIVDAFIYFGDKTMIQYIAAYIVPKATIPAALTLLYLRWGILQPRFLKKIELTPIKSRYYKTKYVLEAGIASGWLGVDMVCLFLTVMGFFTVGSTWSDAHTTLQFIEKFYMFWAVPFFAILIYLLTNKKF